MSTTDTAAPNELPAEIGQALNQLARCRSLLYEAEARSRIRTEIDELLAQGMSPADALEHLRANPPVLSPNF